LAHDLGAASDFVHRLAFDAQRGEEGGHLRVRRRAVHDLVHHGFDFGARQVVAVYKFGDSFADHV